MKKMLTAMLSVALLTVCALPVMAQRALIDVRLNTMQQDSKDYFNWSVDGKSVKDMFDVTTGASRAKSTAEFNVVRFDASGSKKAIPAGLRSLVLYPVSPRSVYVDDAFTVMENGKQLTIRYIHRGTAYRVTTDATGRIDTASSFEIATGIAENLGGKFVVKAEYLKEGGDASRMADIDWSTVTFMPDRADSDAGYQYAGVLTARMNKGILTVKGTLKK
ncbi:MAG: hypothetical protein IJ191_07580 [Treponema sp.]|nr:hypothetical protein [Treponema sp.]